MLTPAPDYDSLVAAFRWRIPERYNIGVDVCDRWAAAEPGRAAILEIGPDGRVATLTYGALRERSNRLANALRARGIGRGDRVAILLPQGEAVPIAHIAVYKLGAVALPLAALFAIDALAYRLADAGAKALVTNAAGLGKLQEIRPDLPALECVISTDGPDGAAEGFSRVLEAASPDFTPVDTAADDPAMMIYTSGTTGPAKGALHGHRVLLGHLPGWRMMHDFPPKGGDLMWTPSDWAWAGGLLNALMPSLRYGIPVVARAHLRFEPEAVLRMIADLRITNVFLPPTALRMLRAVEAPRERFDLSALRNIASAGEALGPETFAWAERELGLTIGEAYGQTECNLVLAACRAAGVARPGSTGKPVPGHRVAILRPDGSEAETDEPGEICVARPDPVMFLRYWNQPEATERKFRGDWMLTGDQARRDADGYIHFVGRE